MLKFECLFGSWTADGVEYVDSVEIESPSAELRRLAGSAHAAGVIYVDEGLDTSHVEDDEESVDNLADAMGEWIEPIRDPETGSVTTPGYWSGPWAEGHLANQTLEAENRDASVAEED